MPEPGDLFETAPPERVISPVSANLVGRCLLAPPSPCRLPGSGPYERSVIWRWARGWSQAEPGFELWTQAMGLRGDVEDGMVGALSPADQGTLSALLKKMLLQVERAPEAP